MRFVKKPDCYIRDAMKGLAPSFAIRFGWLCRPEERPEVVSLHHFLYVEAQPNKEMM